MALLQPPQGDAAPRRGGQVSDQSEHGIWSRDPVLTSDWWRQARGGRHPRPHPRVRGRAPQEGLRREQSPVRAGPRTGEYFLQLHKYFLQLHKYFLQLYQYFLQLRKYFYENVISAESEHQLPCPHHPRAEGHGGEGGGADPAHQGAGLHRRGPHLQVGERVQCS